MKKAAIIEILIDNGHELNEIKNLKKIELNEMLKGISATNALDNALPSSGITDAVMPEETNEEKKKILPTDPEWAQYVLSQFLDDELEGQNPRVDGLRRVAEKLLGEIVEEGCDLIAAPCRDNEFRACAKAWIIFKIDGEYRKFEALADAYPGNVYSEEFNIYSTAMADTRAKGRCLRNALRLRQIVAAEELKEKFISQGKNENDINVGQITAIRLLCDNKDISLSKLLKRLEIDFQIGENGGIKLELLTKDQANSVLNEISKISNNKEILDIVKRGTNE